MPIIEIRKLTKKYNDTVVLNDINASFEKGLIYGLIGRNGSGKTMLLRCICGLVPTYEGQIWIEGLLATSTGRTNTDMGVIIETPGFLHNQTGFQNLKLLASIKNKITDAEICRAIETVGLDADMKKKVGKYSLGMRQRLAIAQAMMENPPILEALAFDSILGDMKLIAEAWDAGGLYQVGSFPSWNRWAEWNGRYRDDLRSFLKGDSGVAGRAITRITGSSDMYDPASRGYSASVNFLTCHDGFTLYDLYSYNEKHNEKNGWNNTDGDNNGLSWNCGVEGETDDPAVMSLRRRLVKNAFAALLCSRGPAMFFAGDEFCNTQYGNNNAYCQDNIISWLDWNRLEEFQEIHDFARFMIHFRAKHPILRRDTKPAVCGLPSVSIHNGEPNRNYTDYNTHLIGIMYAGRNADDTDDDMIFYGMNAYWEPLEMRLPSLPESYHWKLVVNTFCEYQDGADFEAQTQGDQTRVRVPERSTVILLAEHDL